MKKYRFKTEKGSILVLFAISLVAIISMMVLAVDLSNAYLNKTRLQNLVDSLALSAAVSLGEEADNTTNSISGAKTTFDQFVATAGNNSLNNDVIFSDILFEFSTLWAGPYVDKDSATNPNFVRVAINSFPSTIFFGGILNVSSLNITASAVAGPLPIEPCNILPIAACSGYTELGAEVGCPQIVNGIKTCFGLPFYDQSASATAFKRTATPNEAYNKQEAAAWDPPEDYPEEEFIYTYPEKAICSNSIIDPLTNLPSILPGVVQPDFCSINLKGNPGGNTEIGAGNFNLLSFSDSSSADDLKKYFAGGFDHCGTIIKGDPPTIDTKTGQATGPVLHGINSRFLHNENTGGLDDLEFVADFETSPTPSPDWNGSGSVASGCETGPTSGYCDYNTGYNGNSGQRYHRRIVGIPIIKCDGTEDGDGIVEVVGGSCLLLTAPIDPGQKEVYVEILPIDSCDLSGTASETSNLGITNPYIYKDRKNPKDS